MTSLYYGAYNHLVRELLQDEEKFFYNFYLNY